MGCSYLLVRRNACSNLTATFTFEKKQKNKATLKKNRFLQTGKKTSKTTLRAVSYFD